MDEKTKIKVLIADDNEIILKRLSKIINEDKQFEVAGISKSGYEAVMLTALYQPDIILMDIEMEEKDTGIKATKEILKQFPKIKIIILTVYEQDELVYAAFQAGVVDYIIKNANPSEITKAIIDAYYERSPIRPVIAQKIRREFSRVKNTETSFIYYLQIVAQLTASELDLLDLLVQGKTRYDICSIRCVELTTVKSQIHSILKKFQKNNINDVIDIVKELKIFELLKNIKK